MSSQQEEVISLSSSARLRMEAKLAEARLQHIRKEEDLKLETLALIAKQRLKKLESRRIVLQAEAEVEAANIRAEAASVCDDRYSLPEAVDPPLTVSRKVGAYLSDLELPSPSAAGNGACELAAPSDNQLHECQPSSSLPGPSLAADDVLIRLNAKRHSNSSLSGNEMQNTRPVVVNSHANSSTADNVRHRLRDVGSFVPGAIVGKPADFVMTTASSGFRPTALPCVDVGVDASRVHQRPPPGVSFAVADLSSKPFEPLAIPVPLVDQLSQVGPESLPGERGPLVTSVSSLAQYAPVVCSNPCAGWSPPTNTLKQDKRRYGPAVTSVESMRLYDPTAISAAKGDPAVTPYSTVKQVSPVEVYRPANISSHSRGSYQQAALPYSLVPRERNKREYGCGSMSPGESCSLNDVAKLLVRCKGSGPPLELTKFDGDPLQYHKFIRQVEDRILSIYQESGPGHALHLLLDCTTGRAHKLISSCVMYPPDRGLNKALSLLYNTFGSPQVAVQVFLDFVCSGKTVSNTELGLETFYSDLVKCKIVLEASGAESVLNAVSTAERVFMRLPLNLREGFAKLALERGFEIDVVPFDLFIEQRRRLLCSRFGRLLQPVKGKHVPLSKFSQRSRANFVQSSHDPIKSAHSIGRTTEKIGNLTACSFCDARDHVIFRCETFLQKSATER